MELTNWAGNLTYSADSVHHPASVVEVQELVARLPRVKALGTRHSFNTIADSPGGALISLSELAPDVTIDANAMTVSVTGGTRYGVLATALQSQGYALHNTGSLPHISVAGATATGTHGSGDRNKILSTAVAAVDLVTADGSLVTVDRANPDLKALAVGLGAFGVITRVVLEVQPTYLVRQDVYRNAPWDTVLEAFDEVMASAYSVSLLGDFASPVIRQLWQKTRVEEVGEGQDPPQPVPASLHGGTWYDDAEEPPDHSLNVRAGVPGPWSERLPHFRLDAPPSAGGDELQTEYFIDRRHAVDAIRTLRSLGDRISPHLHATEIRTTAADDLWLSPAYERDCLCIGFTWRNHPTEVMALLADIETALGPYEPRPHWGKLFLFTAEDLARRFPRLADFLELTTTYDPTGKFTNAFIDWHLGHSRSS
ncbi:MAG TPA: D-arabinono-1,4-lactone oxidase [Actinomycetota bacterium]|jgi:xylitol oxidase|nr:D-arabinono-1,4-lactone oxidase [Actinomycetota bacterium]